MTEAGGKNALTYQEGLISKALRRGEERILHTDEAAGSRPAPPTMHPLYRTTRIPPPLPSFCRFDTCRRLPPVD